MVAERRSGPNRGVIVGMERRKAIAIGVAGLAAAALFAVVVLPDRTSPHRTVNAGKPNGESVTSADSGPPTSADSIAPSGTAYAPPASTVRPSSTTTTRRPGTTTTAPPAAGDTITVTQDDNGKTFTLLKGQHLIVTLDDPSWEWSDPDTDNASVLERTAVSANPSSTHVAASFVAKAAGQAQVGASKDAPCRRSTPPCMVPTFLWQITINVAA